MPERQRFSSRTATILSMVGVSIGLGNVWRFPYMMGRYGGSAFLVVYLLFTLLFAVPAVMAEWGLGRHARRGPLGAFALVFGPRWGTIVGWILMFTVLVANSYYLVVIGNVVYTGTYSIVDGFDGANTARFADGLNNGWLQYGITLALLAASLTVIHRGLNRGIEAVSKLFVPFFLAVAIVLVVSALSLDGSIPRIKAFLRPDFGAMTSANIFAALGQAFFSLGLGGTFLLMYGSYLRSDESLFSTALMTGLGDATAALLAALFIVPSVLVFGIDMATGPHLIFATLPELFAQMPSGRVLGSFFLTALALVAFLSNVAALEVLVGGIGGDWNRAPPRSTLLVAVGLAEALLILPSALNPDLIGLLDLAFGSGMQVVGSFFAVVAVSWGLSKSTALEQIFGARGKRYHTVYFYWIRWVLPCAMLAILVGYLLSLLR